MAISKKSWLGVALESTPGVAEATPTIFIPCKSLMKGQKKNEQLKEERGTRDAVYGAVDTTREGATDPKGPWYNDTSPVFLLGALGAVASTQPDAGTAPTVHLHNFTLADIPPTLTVFKSYDAATYIGAYAAVEKWSLKISADGKLVESETSLKHLYPVKHTGAAINPTFSPYKPFAGYAPTIELNNVATSDVAEMTIEFSQKLTMFHALDGTPDFVAIYFGERSAKVDFTARFDSDALYARYLAGQEDSLELSIIGPLISGAFNQELKITVPVIHYDSMDHDLGKDNVLVKAKATAIASASGLMSASVQNTVASYAAS